MNNKVRKKTILVVDDVKENIDVMNNILKQEYKVKAAINGRKALEIAGGEETPDLILLDIMMPEMDGYEVCRRLKTNEKTKKIPVIFVTTKSEIEDEVQGFNAGAVDYITKPVSPPIVLARVKTHLDLIASKHQVELLLSKTLMGSLKVLTDILALVSPTAFSQVSRMKIYAREITEKLGLDDIWQFELAAMLSHIGYVALPNEILEKVNRGVKLTEKEQLIFKTHPSVGFDLIVNIPRLDIVADMISKQMDSIDKNDIKGHPRDWDSAILGGQLIKLITEYDKILSSEKSAKSALTKLKNRGGDYPKVLLIALWETQSKKPELIEKRVRLEDLREGMILVDDIMTSSGAVVLTKNTEISPNLLILLKRYIGKRVIREPILVKYLGF